MAGGPRQCRPRNRSSRATRSIQDNCRSTRSIDSIFDPSLDSTRLWSTAIDLVDFLVDSLALLPVAWIVCVVCELVKPFRGHVLMYRRSGLTDKGLPATIFAFRILNERNTQNINFTLNCRPAFVFFISAKEVMLLCKHDWLCKQNNTLQELRGNC